MQKAIKKIALIGPESSGKTTLCEQLASHFKTTWVPEYARSYIAQLSRGYTLEDIEFCARQQLATENELLKTANKILFCDTELILAKVWCEDVFKLCPLWMNREISHRKYDLFLLTAPDLPFMDDPVRENPDRRDYFFSLYKNELETRKFNFEIIRGSGETRFENALIAIEKWLPGETLVT